MVVNPFLNHGSTYQELEKGGSNKRQKAGSDVVQQEKGNNAINATKKQARVSGDTASPATTRKRARGSSVATDAADGSSSLAESTTTISELDGSNVPAIRESAIEKRMEMIKQLLEQKESELKEIAFLEAGHNLMDFDPSGEGKLISNEEITDPAKGQRSSTPLSRNKRQPSSDALQSHLPPATSLQTPPPSTPQGIIQENLIMILN